MSSPESVKKRDMPSCEQFVDAGSPVEIERKYLIDSIPGGLSNYPSEEIAQGYIAISKDGTEVRLRKKGEKYLQTVKSGRGVSRHEFEIDITKE